MNPMIDCLQLVTLGAALWWLWRFAPLHVRVVLAEVDRMEQRATEKHRRHR